MMTRQALKKLHALKELQREIRAEDDSLERLKKRAQGIGFTATLSTTEAIIFQCPGRTIHCGDLAAAWYRIALLTKAQKAIT